MSNFTVEFAYPWLWLLLIPALGLAFFMHFRINKKHRRNRNRIISLVLHVVVAVLCVSVLTGMSFSYDTVNDTNEIMIVTDYSYSGAEKENDKNEFVRSIIEESGESFQVGVVTFGYDQVYAAPLDNDTKKVYDDFKNAKRPDDSATDIASALNFAREKLTQPSTAQIIIISDGLQTDRNALDVIQAIAADGVRVSSMYFPNEKALSEVQVNGVIMPSTNPGIDEPFRLGVTIQSSVSGAATIRLWDNKRVPTVTDITLEQGVRDYYVDCTFVTGGMHVLKVSVTPDEKTSEVSDKNNEYYTYVNIESFNKVLIVEREDGESEALESVLTEKNAYDVTVVNIKSNALPHSVNELRVYDQVILNNIANADMPSGFIDNLEVYVRSFGGGLFTVGGNKMDDQGRSVANTYVERDMAGTLYQQMLPVQAIEYTPPVAVMIIIDKSGSMEGSRMDAAKDGAKAAIKALTSRDYCGIMTLTDDYTTEQTLAPVTQYELLFKSIDNIEAGGGTYYTNAIDRAGRVLSTERRVERKHIVLVSDGMPADTTYIEAIRRNYENYGVTFSVIIIEPETDTSQLKKATEEVGHGRFHEVITLDLLVDEMRNELNVDEIKAVNYEDFTPKIYDSTKVVAGINQLSIPQIGGFYGTREKEADSVEVPLKGEYVPIYAQWKYGDGKVGSFMCDLNGGVWSSSFMEDEVGKQIIRNIVSALMPTRNIHPQAIDVGFEEDNYTTNISIYTEMASGESIGVAVNKIEETGEIGAAVNANGVQNGYSRLQVAITEPGVYQITVSKLNASGNVIGTYSAYRAFSYSKEYDLFYDAETGSDLLRMLAQRGGGQVLALDAAWALFESQVSAIHHVMDPRLVLIIIAMILFLLDIAVRKFKFKWIHEIVRERKERLGQTSAK